MLTNAAGMTLYTLDKDAGGKSACNGPCAKNSPLLKADANAVHHQPRRRRQAVGSQGKGPRHRVEGHEARRLVRRQLGMPPRIMLQAPPRAASVSWLIEKGTLLGITLKLSPAHAGLAVPRVPLTLGRCLQMLPATYPPARQPWPSSLPVRRAPKSTAAPRMRRKQTPQRRPLRQVSPS